MAYRRKSENAGEAIVAYFKPIDTSGQIVVFEQHNAAANASALTPNKVLDLEPRVCPNPRGGYSDPPSDIGVDWLTNTAYCLHHVSKMWSNQRL